MTLGEIYILLAIVTSLAMVTLDIGRGSSFAWSDILYLALLGALWPLTLITVAYDWYSRGVPPWK